MFYLDSTSSKSAALKVERVWNEEKISIQSGNTFIKHLEIYLRIIMSKNITIR